MTGPHRWNEVPTPRSAYRGHNSFTNSFVAWGYSGMVVKMNLFHPFLAIVKTNWGYGDTAGTPPSLSKVTILFHGAGPRSPTGYRGEINPQVGVTLSRGDLRKIFLKPILLEKKGKWVWNVSNKHSENQWGFWPKDKFQWMKYKLKNYTESELWARFWDTFDSFSLFLSFSFLTINVLKKSKKNAVLKLHKPFHSYPFI